MYKNWSMVRYSCWARVVIVVCLLENGENCDIMSVLEKWKTPKAIEDSNIAKLQQDSGYN